jgi:hypothetical protein
MGHCGTDAKKVTACDVLTDKSPSGWWRDVIAAENAKNAAMPDGNLCDEQVADIHACRYIE